MNGNLIDVECSSKYLGHMITNSLSNDEDIERHLWYFNGNVSITHIQSNTRTR